MHLTLWKLQLQFVTKDSEPKTLVMSVLYESEHTKLVTSLINKSWLAVFYLKTLPYGGINKSQGDPLTLIIPAENMFLCALPCLFQYPIYNCIFLSLLLNSVCSNPPLPSALDYLFWNIYFVIGKCHPQKQGSLDWFMMRPMNRGSSFRVQANFRVQGSGV